MPTGKIGEAKQRDDGKWEVAHADGETEVLSDKQFHEQYDLPEDAPAEEDKTTGKPAVESAEKFTNPVDYVKKYIEEVEAELKAYEAGIKAVRAEINALKKSKDEAPDFGPLRHAIHELSHGNPLTRTAHAVTVPHDGPERLREAPDALDNVSSGPGEETNAEVAASRHAGR